MVAMPVRYNSSMARYSAFLFVPFILEMYLRQCHCLQQVSGAPFVFKSKVVCKARQAGNVCYVSATNYFNSSACPHMSLSFNWLTFAWQTTYDPGSLCLID